MEVEFPLKGETGSSAPPPPQCPRGLLWPSKHRPQIKGKRLGLATGNVERLGEMWNNVAADDQQP